MTPPSPHPEHGTSIVMGPYVVKMYRDGAPGKGTGGKPGKVVVLAIKRSTNTTELVDETTLSQKLELKKLLQL